MTGTDFVDLLARLRALAQHEHSDVSIADEAADAIEELQNRDLGLLSLLYDIRKAAGDPEGKLMQAELVARIAGLSERVDRLDAECKDRIRQALSNGQAALEAEARIDAANVSALKLRETIGNEYLEATARRRLLVVTDQLEQALGKGGKP